MKVNQPFDANFLNLQDILINNAVIENNAGFASLENGKFYFDINYAFEPAINIALNKIRIIFVCNIETKTNNNKKIKIGGKFEISYIFEVEKLANFVMEVGEVIEIDNELAISLANIAYTTTRGIIYAKCQGTILQSLILPVTSTDALINVFLKQKT